MLFTSDLDIYPPPYTTFTIYHPSWVGSAVSRVELYHPPQLSIFTAAHTIILSPLDDSNEAQSYETVTSRPHEASWSHELIGGAAAYEAMKAYENHEAANGTRFHRSCASTSRLTVFSLITGQIDDHAKAKEFIAGIAGAFVDREVETRGLDFIDRERAKRHAQERAEEQLANSGRW